MHVVSFYAGQRLGRVRSVRLYLNISQLLAILGSNGMYVRENAVGTSYTRSVSHFCTYFRLILRVRYYHFRYYRVSGIRSGSH